MKNFILVGIFLVIAISSPAQKRGSSADKPWKEDIIKYSFPTDTKNNTARQVPTLIDFKEELV